MTKTMSKRKKSAILNKRRMQRSPLTLNQLEVIRNILLDDYEKLDVEVINKIRKITNIHPPIITIRTIRLIIRKIKRLDDYKVNKLYLELEGYFIMKIKSLLNENVLVDNKNFILTIFDTDEKELIFEKLHDMSLLNLKNIYFALKSE